MSSEDAEASLPHVPDDTKINTRTANNNYANTDKEREINGCLTTWKMTRYKKKHLDVNPSAECLVISVQVQQVNKFSVISK